MFGIVAFPKILVEIEVKTHIAIVAISFDMVCFGLKNLIIWIIVTLFFRIMYKYIDYCV